MSTDVAGQLSFGLSSDSRWLLVIASMLLVAWIVGLLDVRRAAPSARIGVGWLVLARLLSGVAVMLATLQPQWSRQSVTLAQGQVALLVDRSRSMTVADHDDSRAELARGLLERWLRERVPSRLAGFGSDVSALSQAGLVDPATLQDGSDIAGAIERVASSSGTELGAIVLLSDGHHRGDSIHAARLAALGVRVHTVAIGAAESAEDDAIAEVLAPAVSFVHQPGALRVKVRAPARAGTAIPVLLRERDAVVGDAVARLDEHGLGEAELRFTPTRVGRALYQVEIPIASQDPLPENNRRAVLVRVGRERTRVLLVSGRPGWDARYLRGLLNGDPAVDLITFFILRTTHDMTMAPPEEMSLIPFPTDELFREHLDSFDVLIFQDFEYGPYEMARYLPGIADYVRRGGSFAMIGGSQSFGAGGYARTPISEILPVQVRDGFDASEGAFRPVMHALAVDHPIVRLGPDLGSTRALWRDAASMLGMHRFGALRPGAQALLVTPGQDNAASVDPSSAVLVVGTAGKGRVLALGVDTSWRWGIASAAQSGDASLYDRFWDRALRWLTRDPLLEPSLLTTDEERYAPGASIRLRGTLRDEHYRPLASRALRLRIRDMSDGVVHEQELSTDFVGQVDAALDAPLKLGGYRIEVGDELASVLAEQMIVVERGGPELSDVTAQPETLAAIAKATGGTHIADIRKAPALADLDRSRSRIAGVDVHAPFRSWWFIALTIALLTFEWLLRRRAGLR